METVSAKRGKAAMAIDTYEYNSPVYGRTYAEVEYDWNDTTQTGTTRISRVYVDNRGSSVGARFKVYIPHTTTTPTFNELFQPGVERTFNIPGGQNYFQNNSRMSFSWDPTVT